MENNKFKILAIDDKNDNLISLKALIKEAFPDSIRLTASNGAAGIALAQAEDPGVILLDVVMPGMDGFEVCQKLKANPETSNIPVIFLTALKGDKQTRIRALEVGAEAFLAKPIDELELTAQIRAMLKIKAANDQKQKEKEHLAQLVEDQTRELTQNYTATLNLLVDLQEENEARLRSETTLRQSEEKFSIMFRKAPFSAALSSISDLKIVEVNEQFEKLWGLSSAEAVGKTSDELGLYPDINERARLSAIFQERGFIHGIESKMKSKSGELKDVLINSDIVNIGNEQFVLSSVQNITERKQAEESLRESQEQFRIAQDMSPDGFTILRPVRDAQERVVDFTWIYENAAVARLNGTDPEAVVGQRLLELFPSHRESPILKAYQQVAESGESCIFEADYSGESMLKPTSFRIVVVSMAGDIAILAQDITERKQAENALRESEEHFRRAVISAPIPIMIHAEDGQVITINTPWTQLTGYEHSDIPTIADWTRKAFGTQMDLVRDEIDHLYTLDGPKIEGEYTINTSFGEQRIWDFSSAPIGQLPDGRRLVISMAMDITERKKLETERKKFFLLAESSSEFIGMCDLELNPIYVNPAGQRLVGLPDMAAACRVKVPDYFFPEDQRFIAEEFFPRVLREGHGDVEIRLRHFLSGEPIWMYYYLFRVLDARGTLVGWATVSHDKTEQRLAESQVKEQLVELQRWHKATSGREDRVLELKREVNELLSKAGQPPRYASVESQDEKEK